MAKISERRYNRNRGTISYFKKKELEQQLYKKEQLVQRITAVIEPLSGDEKVNLTDSDAPRMRGKKGNTDVFYNVQIACNEHQIILYSNVNTDANDKQQLQPCVKGTKLNTQQKIEQVIADPGYASFDNYEFLEQEKITGYLPDQDFNKDFKDKPYHKEFFKFDSKKDQLICPKGKVLKFSRQKNEKGNSYKVYKGTACENCPVRDQCTKAKDGIKTVMVERREPLKQQMRQRLESDLGKAIYKKRLHPIEAIFGHLKFNLNFTNFSLRSLEKVNAEFTLMCIAYNLRKLATLCLFLNAIILLNIAPEMKIPICQRTFSPNIRRI